MNAYADHLVSYLLAQGWQVALLTVIVGLASLALRNRSAHIRYLLWLVVLAKCLVPPFLNVPLAILPEGSSSPFVAGVVLHEEHLAPEAPVSVGAAPRPRESPPARVSLREWIALVWALGAFSFLLWVGGRAVRYTAWLRDRRRPLPLALQESIQGWSTGFKFRKLPKIWLLEDISQPFVWGVLRGSVYLPADFAGLSGSDQHRGVLAHELSHIVRFDAGVNLLQVMVQAMYWFHPFVWWTNRKIRQEREKCCDEMAIVHLNTLPEHYTGAIVDVLAAERRSAHPIPSLAIVGSVRDIEERIRTMLKPGKKFYKRPSLVAATVALLIALVTIPTALVLTARGQAQPPTQSADKPAANSEKSEQPRFAARTFNSSLALYIYVQETAQSGYGRIGQTPGAAPLEIPACRIWWVAPATPVKDWDLLAREITQNKVPGLALYGATDSDLQNLASLTGLQYLSLVNSQITDAGLEHLHGVTGLQELELKNTQITDKGLEHLRGLTGLQQLVLSNTKITDAGLVHLGGLTKLQLLDLTDTPITDAGLAYLKGLTGLQELRLANTQITDAGLEQLKGLKGLGLDSLNRAAAAGDVERVKSYLAQGVDANKKDRDGSTPLHYAARKGHGDVVQLLIAKGANIDATDAAGQTPLHRACRDARRDVSALLLAKGANVNARDKAGDTPLHAALGRGEVDRDFLEFLLAKGADVKARNEQGETPLHLAPKTRRTATYTKHREEAADVLLAHGAEVDAMDKSGSTPLHVAAQRNQAEVVALLLAKGAAVDRKTNDGLLALHSAVMGGYKEIVALLLAKGANVNTAQPSGGTPLHDAAKAGYNEIAEILIAKGAEVNAKNARGETPAQVAMAQDPPGMVRLLLARGGEVSTIQLAAYAGDLAKVKGYIEKGISVNTQDGYGLTALHAAAAAGQKEVAEYLIAAGASVNAASAADGLGTPLHYAAHSSSTYVADLLVFKGAPVDAGNGKGETPLHLAAQMGNTEMCRRLITSKANVNLRARNRWTPLHYAAASGQKDAATLLLEKGADIDASTDSASGTPLYMAASQRHKEVVKLLVDKGADVSASSTDLLYYAAWRGYKELAEACIKKGANVNAKSPGPWGGDAVALYVFYDDGPDSWGDVLELLLAHGADPNANDGSWSLLHYAVYEDISIVRNLLDKGANPNVIDTGGKSPLHYAAEEGRRPAVELLIARGADLNTKDYEGRTPLSLAKEKGHNEIVDLLRKHGAKE